MTRHLVLAFALAGCNGSHGAPSDGTQATPDGPATPQGAHYHYVLDRVYVPASNSEATTYGLDLDHDFMVDNALGQALVVLEKLGFAAAASSETALDRGDTILLADLQTPAFPASVDAGLTFYAGTNPMPLPCGGPSLQCRQHLHGTGSFDVAPTPRDPPLVSTPVSGELYVGPGHISVELVPFGKPLMLDLIGAYVQVMTSETALTAGIVGGALVASDIDGTLLPALLTPLQEAVARDCPGDPPICTCFDGSQGKTAISLFDTNHDCAISIDELRDSPLIATLLTPDVTVEGQSGLSFGMGFTAVPATFDVH